MYKRVPSTCSLKQTTLNLDTWSRCRGDRDGGNNQGANVQGKHTQTHSSEMELVIEIFVI